MTLPNPCPNVRFCNEGDRERLLAFVRAGHKEDGVFTMSDDKVRRVIADAINPPKDEKGNVKHLVMIGIIDAPNDSNRIAASLALEYTQAWYSEDWSLFELWNNVNKDYRKSTYANDLIKFGKWISDSTKRCLSMGILTTQRLEAKEHLYARKLQKVGAIFVHNLAFCEGPAIVEAVR
jgi:hypothetical protein